MILQEIWLAWQDLDELSLWSILAKSLAYWTTLLAAGSVLNLLWLRETAPQTISLLRWFGPICAVFAILLNSSLIPLNASYLMGEWSTNSGLKSLFFSDFLLSKKRLFKIFIKFPKINNTFYFLIFKIFHPILIE